VAHASAAETLLGVQGEWCVGAWRGEVCFAMGASVSAAYEAVAEGLFNLVHGFAEEVFGVVGSAVGEVAGSFVLAIKEVVFLLGEEFALG
jgi:hypothetical protein